MEATSHGLLKRACSRSANAWEHLDRLYRPYLIKWFLAHGVSLTDSEDLTQEVMATAFRELKVFVHSDRVGAFRVGCAACVCIVYGVTGYTY